MLSGLPRKSRSGFVLRIKSGKPAEIVAFKREDIEGAELHFGVLLTHFGTSLTYDNWVPIGGSQKRCGMVVITTQSIVRCTCGHRLSDLREINEDGDGKQKFLTQRCENCGYLLIVRNDGLVMATH